MRDNYNELSGCNTDKNNLEKDRVDYDSHLNSLVQKVSNTILYSPLTKNLYSSLYNVVAPPVLQPIGNAIRALNNVLGCDDSVNINNIEQWEESHDNYNKELRNTLDVMKSNRLTTPFAVAYEKFMDKKELREAAFPFKSLKHTIAATDIFPGIKYKNYKISYENISTQAQMFADEYHRLYNENNGLGVKNTYISKAQNAIRHTIWQATIASLYGAKVARDAGDSHEIRPFADVNKKVFNSEVDADMTVDLLNNKIGRKIGVEHINKSAKEIALLVLEEFKNNGLYSYEKGVDERWYISKKKLPENVYYLLYKRFLQLNENSK